GNHLPDGDDRVRGADRQVDDACLEVAAWEGEQGVNEDGEADEAEDDPDRVWDRVVRLGEGADEPGQPDRGHQDAEAVVRPPCPRDEPGGDEGPGDDEVERRAERGVGVVVAREDEPERNRAEGDPRHEDEREAGSPQTGVSRSTAIAWPDSSPLGMNARAPLRDTNGP